MELETTEEADSKAAVDFWRRLLHRWLVQYNPLYLLSASLSLAGMILCSRGLAREGSLHGEVAVAAIAELYAVALIGGAALLTRIGQRRPAVLLALLAALYQCDLTLHTEASPFLGPVGVAAAAAWAALFVAKLYGLAWAVRVRLSRGAAAVATYGALGLAILPHRLHTMDSRGASALVAFWLFTLFGLGLQSARGVVSSVELDAWGRTVLRRSLRAVWLLWSVLLVLHVGFWSMSSPVRIAAFIPVALLIGTRWIRREMQVWFVVAATLALIGVQLPEHFAISALMAAATLVIRAIRRPEKPEDAATPPEPDSTRSPYRVVESTPPTPITPPAVRAVAPAWSFAPPGPGERRRLIGGAVFGAYLAVWTLGWTGGSWPAHLAALDIAFTAVALLVMARTRIRVVLVPLTATYIHFAVEARLVSAPGSILGWGVASVGLGFALLIASLAASYALRKVDPNA